MKRYAKAVVASLAALVILIIGVAGDDNVQWDGGEIAMFATAVASALGVYKVRNENKVEHAVNTVTDKHTGVL